jgi:exodeoxyribonuclease VII large subunit
MMNDPSSENPTSNVPIFSVGEISTALKRTVEDTFDRVRVRGEISGFKRAASGHLYFTLKDDAAVLDSVCWRGTAGRINLQPEDGMEIIATGRLTTYGARSKYQMVVDTMELAGEGALLKMLEDRRKKLSAEGLFDEDRKQELPYLPETIGVITSPTGAVIRDILHRLDDRFGRHVLLWPVLVQGNTAADQVTAAINGFNAMPEDGKTSRPDLIIVARGGGSLEDLWAFNEEVVVRAVANSDIPVISAVGHETDTTLIDFASDRRAPTPTAAAEIAVPVRSELAAQVLDDGARMASAMNRMLSENRLHLQSAARGLPNLGRILGESSQRLDDWGERLGNALQSSIASKRSLLSEIGGQLRKPDHLVIRGQERLGSEVRALKRAGQTLLKEKQSDFSRLSELLESYSYARVLDRGFALVRDAGDEPVMSAAGLSAGDQVSVTFRDGERHMMVTDGESGKLKPKKLVKKQTSKPPKDNSDQGTLL